MKDRTYPTITRTSSPTVLIAVILFCFASNALSAAEFLTRIIDGQGHPVSNVVVEVGYPKKRADSKLKEVKWVKSLSDGNGAVKLEFDETSLPTSESLNVNFTKEGYAGYSTYGDDLRREYVVKRQFHDADVRRIAKLSGDAQRSEVKELLAGDYERERHGGESFEDLMFFHERQFRPVLRSLLQDKQVGTEASSLLAFIGIPEDLRLVVQHAPPPKRTLFEDRWAYGVVCALLEPDSDEEWTLLKKAALNDYDDLWVDEAAIKTLRLIASPRSLEILQEVRKKNTDREGSIARAVDYIESKPPLLADPDLIEAGKKVARAIMIGDWEENKQPRFNEEGDMALIDCEFVADRDLLVHTATFQKVDGVWKLRGVRETMQALLANPPDRKGLIGTWHGYSADLLEFARLELKEDGTGLLGVSYLPDSSPKTYLVKWTQRRFNLDVTVEPAEPEAEAIRLQDVAFGHERLEFVIHGIQGDWSSKMTLFNEAEFLKRADAVKKTLQNFHKSK